MSILRIIGVVLGLLLLFVGGGLALLAFLDSQSTSNGDLALLAILLVGVAVLGLFLVRRSSPEFFGKLVRSPARCLIRFGRWLIQPSARSSPLGMAIWTLLIALLLMALAPRGGARGAIAMIGYLIYLFFAMVALVAKPRWWRRALLTLLLGPVVMTGLIATAEAFEDRVVGEASLGFVGLLMWSWAIIPVTGLIRLVVSRPSAPPDSAGQAS
jgi:hypothetical protein